MTSQDDSQQNRSKTPVVHRAQWVVAGFTQGRHGLHHGLLEDGAVVIADGLIRAVGHHREIIRDYGQYPTRQHEGRVLAPALINAHCHLELSYMENTNQQRFRANYLGDQTEWIRDLLTARDAFFQETPDAEAALQKHARKTLQSLASDGVAFVGDVGNSMNSRFIGENQDVNVTFLLEILGFTRESEAKSLARLNAIASEPSLQLSCTPHAPYSTTPALIRAIKQQAARLDRIISIHVAESIHEVEFLQNGRGPFREFLVERGAWDDSFAIPGKGPVQYLDDLGVLDEKTLCVHGVHLAEEEIELLAQRNAKVCLCPGSNRFLDVGKAPVTEFLEHGILPALGTDSMASNEVLSMWREMRLLREDHPGLAPEAVLAMATLGGAAAWGMDAALGALAPGRQALMLAIDCADNILSAGQVFEYLTAADKSPKIEWVV